MSETALDTLAEESIDSDAPREEESSQGINHLCIAIFERSMLDLYSTRPSVRTRAEEWFISEDTTWLFSFESICDILFSTIDPPVEADVIRRKILSRELLIPSLALQNHNKEFLAIADELEFHDLDTFDSSEFEVGELAE